MKICTFLEPFLQPKICTFLSHRFDFIDRGGELETEREQEQAIFGLKLWTAPFQIYSLFCRHIGVISNEEKCASNQH